MSNGQGAMGKGQEARGNGQSAIGKGQGINNNTITIYYKLKKIK
jgi:hypothetical protein